MLVNFFCAWIQSMIRYMEVLEKLMKYCSDIVITTVLLSLALLGPLAFLGGPGENCSPKHLEDQRFSTLAIQAGLKL